MSMRLHCTFIYTLLALGFMLQSVAVLAQTQNILTEFEEDSLKTLLRKSKADTNRINLYLELGNPVMDGSGKPISNLDTVYSYNRKAQKLSEVLDYSKGQILANYHIAYIFLQRENYERSRRLVKLGIQLSKQNGFKIFEAHGWHYLGDTYADDAYDLGDIYKSSENETIREKIRCFEQSISLYKQAGELDFAGDLHFYTAFLHFSIGNAALAAHHMLESIHIYKLESSPPWHLRNEYYLLSQAQHVMGNYPKALEYGLIALKTAEWEKDTNSIYLYNFHLGNVYLELKQPAKAQMQFNQASLYVHKVHSLSIRSLSTITHSLKQLGKTEEALRLIHKVYNETPPARTRDKMMYLLIKADCYLTLKRYAEAEKNIIELMDYHASAKANDIHKMAVFDKAAKLYLEMKEYEKARIFSEKAILLNKKHKYINAAMQQQLIIFKIDSAQGNFKKAIAHYQNYKTLNDSIYSEKNSQQIANFEIQYETREKEQNIALLTKKNEIQQANLEKRDLYQQMFSAGALMLLLLLALTYNRYRLKRRSTLLLENKQQEINLKNQSLQLVLQEKVELLKDKEALILHQDDLLEQKEWLLKEIHHRVKNNLQIVMSLLNSQAAYLQDSNALSAIKESHQRVQTISLIHQKLYQSENVALIEIPSYIKEVTEYLSDSFDSHSRIKFDLDIVPLELDVAIAVPLGLLINEAVTNCLKYAFPGDRAGRVGISIRQVDSVSYLLSIADNGIGLQADFDPKVHRSLGMSLIQGLSKQLGGDLRIESISGLKISILFINSLLIKPYVNQV